MLYKKYSMHQAHIHWQSYTVIVLWSFDMQNCFVCSTNINWIAYANAANIVNKDSPLAKCLSTINKSYIYLPSHIQRELVQSKVTFAFRQVHILEYTERNTTRCEWADPWSEWINNTGCLEVEGEDWLVPCRPKRFPITYYHVMDNNTQNRILHYYWEPSMELDTTSCFLKQQYFLRFSINI